MSLDIQLPLQYPTYKDNFTVTNGTLAKILVPALPAGVMTAISGETALPDESAVRQRVFTGGCRVIDATVASTDSVAKSMLLWYGTYTSINAATSTVDGVSAMTSLVITTQNTLTRGAGSYITDGWTVGDLVMLFGSSTTANNGVLGIVTGVTATVLTTNGTVWTNETVAANAQLYKVSRSHRIGIPLSSGDTDAAANVKLVNNANDQSSDTTGVYLGPNEALICGMVAAVSALPAYVSVTAKVGRL